MTVDGPASVLDRVDRVWRRACAVAACRFYREPGRSGKSYGSCLHDDQGYNGCPRHRRESAGTLMTGETREVR